MNLKIIMADPAGNRTAIVRTPVPTGLRAAAAAKIMQISELRVEQVGFETAALQGGEGRLEMMGGEFCGNAARSYGYLLCLEKTCPESVKAEADAVIEISGYTGQLRVSCDLSKGASFAQMPIPERLEKSAEGYPLVISEGITHMILEDMDPDPELVRHLTDCYGQKYDAFGMQFLRGNTLTPVVYVAAAGSLVYESSCGSGSLAAAWYFSKRKATPENRGINSESDDVFPGGSEKEALYTFQEPGGEIQVRLLQDGRGNLEAFMGGRIRLEDEIEVTI